MYYYKGSSKTEAEEFDRMMTVIDFQDAEKDIVSKYSKAFEWFGYCMDVLYVFIKWLHLKNQEFNAFDIPLQAITLCFE